MGKVLELGQNLWKVIVLWSPAATDDIQVASVANWPDFVFETGYKLRNLSSLSDYIERGGHLPGVPKAEVVGRKGTTWRLWMPCHRKRSRNLPCTLSNKSAN
ncbi:hypothetical protein APR41_04595 [Salegentibacter salinarum]|uniref:Uncharacterized protein n=1 Tax=Salegentibacter salinarum TaxID=447422 RepID=A0A2N0TUN1_9FLAO|nr:hypothetical protein APR41_04595 [Salegentibacter salinarum]